MEIIMRRIFIVIKHDKHRFYRSIQIYYSKQITSKIYILIADSDIYEKVIYASPKDLCRHIFLFKMLTHIYTK